MWMWRFTSRFIDPTTDFGFKRLFAEENNKEITIGFLNDLLELPAPLCELTFSPREQLPFKLKQQEGVYDLLCRDEHDNRYLVEMQKRRTPIVRDRMHLYSSFPIIKTSPFRQEPTALYETSGSRPGKWQRDFRLSGVFCVAILAFPLRGIATAINFESLRNEWPPREQYYDKITFVTIDLPYFDPELPEYDLSRRINKWLYFLEFASELDDVPSFFKGDKVFEKLLWEAASANLTAKEMWDYQMNLKQLRDAEAQLWAK